MAEIVDLEALIGEKELKAYQNYLDLTSFANYLSYNENNFINQMDYSNRDMSFPVDIIIKG